MLIEKRCEMGLFGFGSKKKAPDQQSVPSSNQDQALQQPQPADLPPLPPLPPSDDLNAEIAQQLAKLQSTSASQSIPADDDSASKTLELNPDKEENFDWTASNDPYSPSTQQPQQEEQQEEKEPLSPDPEL